MRSIIKYILIYIFISLTANTAASELLSWEKFSDHEEAPKWFRDAKFGIYFHWGPYSVPAYGNEHYPRTMYGHPSGKMPIKSDPVRYHHYSQYVLYDKNLSHFEYIEYIQLMWMI